MAEFDFADGFDVSEPLAWGLTPAQVGAAACGLVLAYLDLSSPLPRPAALPLAVLLGATGLGLALARRGGRPLIAWLGVAARFWTRPRRGFLVLATDPDAGPPPDQAGAAWDAPGSARGGASCGRREGRAQAVAPPVETGRRVPLVLLPEPVTPDGAEGGGRRGAVLRPGPGGLRLADAGILEAPPRGDWWGPRLVPPPRSRTMRRLTFFSLSGGTGRTTLAVEVAGLLAGRTGATGGAGNRMPRVALVDLDLLNARAGIRLGVPLPVGWNLLDTDAADAALARHRVLHRSGVEVFPGPPRPVSRNGAGRADGPLRVAPLLAGLERRGCDVAVIDIPAGLGSISRRVLESADEIFVVLTETAGGVHDAYRSTAALRELGLGNRLRYVVNRSHGAGLLDEAMLDLGGSLVAAIPDDPALERAEAEHRLVGLNGSGRTAEALRALAAAVDPGMAAPGGSGHLHRPRRRRWRRAS